MEKSEEEFVTLLASRIQISGNDDDRDELNALAQAVKSSIFELTYFCLQLGAPPEAVKGGLAKPIEDMIDDAIEAFENRAAG